jgi:hypothetical protein
VDFIRLEVEVERGFGIMCGGRREVGSEPECEGEAGFDADSFELWRCM